MVHAEPKLGRMWSKKLYSVVLFSAVQFMWDNVV